MRLIRIYIFLVFIVAPLFQAVATIQQFPFMKHQVDNGLSHNTVWCTLQDSYGFMWFGTNEGLNCFDGKHYKVFINDPDNKNSLGNNSIHSLYEDNQKRLWVGTDVGIYLYDLTKEVFSRFDMKTEDGVRISCSVTKIITDDSGKIWISTQGQGFFIYDQDSATLKQNTRYSSYIPALYKSPTGKIYLSSYLGHIIELDSSGRYINTYESPALADNIRNINVTDFYYKDGILWYGLDFTGLVRLDLQTKETKVFIPNANHHTASASRIWAIHPHSDGEFLLGTDNGLFLFDIQKNSFTRIDNQADPQSLNDKTIHHIYRDSEGGRWFSTKYGGVNYLPVQATPFEHYHPFYSNSTKCGKIIRKFCEDKQGNIWIATKDEGISILDTSANSITSYPHTSSHNINTIMLDGDLLWVGTSSQGLEIHNLKTGKIVKHQYRKEDSHTINDNCVQVIYKNRKNDIYIGTVWGLNKYNKETGNFSPVVQLGNQTNIADIMEDSRGFMWIATHNTGVLRFNTNNEGWTSFSYFKNNPKSLMCNKITTIFEDSRQRLWLGTEEYGLCTFNYEDDSFTPFDPDKKILPSQIIYRIEEDEQNNLWVSSNSGLICINPETKKIVGHYTKENGLQSNQFNYLSSLRTSDGRMYFGGINGFNAFYPKEFKKNSFAPNLFFTDLSVYGQKISASDPDSPLHTSIYDTKELTLKYDQNSFSLNFAALNYQMPQKNQYAYIVKGLDNRWFYVGNNNTVSFNNLTPGEYTLTVKAAINDSKWNEPGTSIKINILPPFYKSILAYCLYFLIVAVLVYLALTFWSDRIHQKHDVLMKEYQIKREKEAFQSKIEFFTNLVHEIRTPLSLIKIPLECICLSGDGNTETKTYLKTMERSTDRLLNLVNQLLDFRKVEESKFRLTIQAYEINSLVQDVCSRFLPVGSIRNIEIGIYLCPESFNANIDSEAITKIISNLLTNALKYTRDKITITVSKSDTRFEIRVSDNGKGVPQGDMDHIFESFYQSENSISGTGLGLPLAQRLAEMHQGRLFLDKGYKQGASFVLEIPFLNEDLISAELPEITLETPLLKHVNPPCTPEKACEAADTIKCSNGQTDLLLVEDNIELLNVTVSFLNKLYRVHTATNGKEAIKRIEEQNINIIISDLMMPEMDGYEFCEFIKNDSRYCHIPFILLTAKASLNARLKGLEFGADVYMEKPYSLDHLLVQTSSLLENRRRMVEAYTSSVIPPKTFESGISKKDKEFIDKLNTEIEIHLQDPGFCLDSLALNMFMSRSNFYRKIKGLFNMSPNDYLRLFRLRKSIELLQGGEHRIGEVYISVGFSSPSYFTKCFKDQYGVTPKKYIQDLEAGASASVTNAV